MPQSMVHIENLVKRYGDLTALNHLELDIREGEIFGLLGPNGSGKTTAISCLLSLLKYDRGEIKIFGEEMKPDSYKLKEQIGIVLQNVAVFDELTVQENIDYFCGLYIRDRKRRKELVEDAIEFTGLEDFRKMYPRFAGQVMQQGQKIYQAFVDAGLMQMTESEIEALIINIWIVLTNWTNFLYMSGHITDSNHLEEKWIWQALRQMLFLEGAYLRGESRATYERLLETLGTSELFESLSSSKNTQAD